MIEADDGTFRWQDVDFFVKKYRSGDDDDLLLDGLHDDHVESGPDGTSTGDRSSEGHASESTAAAFQSDQTSSKPPLSTQTSDSRHTPKFAVLPKTLLYFSEFASVKIEAADKADPRLGTLSELSSLKRLHQWKQLKLFLRTNNWSSGHRIRAELWKEICRNPSTDAQGLVYSDIVEAFKGRCSVTPVFLTAPGVLLCDYQLNETGRLTLIQLLTAIEHARPDFTYIPILYPLCALFLHYMSDRDAFVCTMSLLSQSQKFLIQTDISVSAARRTLLILLRKHARKVYNLIERLIGSSDDATLIRVFSHWKQWIFCDLPFSHLVRVLDCFLFEGQKVLYRVAISILVLWHREKAKELRDKTGWSEFYIASDISAFCSTMKFSPQKLLKLRNMKMSYIRRIQEENEMKLRKRDATLAEVASSQNLKSLLAEHHYFSVAMSSQILPSHLISLLISWIPTRYHLVTPQKLFSVVEDGRSFTTLWSKIEDCYPTVLLIQTTWKQVFGAYCSEAWVMRKRLSKLSYFGTGESFLFQFTPKAACFSWVGLEKPKVSHGEELFQCADATTLIVGGGGNEGLSIRQTLERGSTNHCDTFNNPPLVPERDFEIEAFEVFGFSAEVE
ncbi:hypothetical protein M514_04225 [Trichuris suis]|uniref:TLDc domain-containing protein n=1 Tax=Trichuris suis TaxID=68888 RepID=A0A085NQC1_9BILA|nr:hypothetical protein M514_04225 [Trichuris suis]